jgi:hypothetical protein
MYSSLIRNHRSLPIAAFIVVLGLAQFANSDDQLQDKSKSMSHTELFSKLAGSWQGTCRTWFQPGKLADESTVEGTFSPVLDGRFLRHVYTGKMKGQARNGEELIGFNTITKSYQVTWIDSFHMNYAIMFSQGEQAERGFTVTAKYDVAENQPPWRWKTVLTLTDEDHVVITAYNITPGGQEAKAVETKYVRVRENSGAAK